MTAVAPSTTTDTEFVYTTYIRTTPEELWRALTEPEVIRRYWQLALISEWKPGSPLLWQTDPDRDPADEGSTVLEFDPPHRLAYTWHDPQPEHAELFGWSDERFAEIRAEPRSKVAFTLEPAGPGVTKLTVHHDGFRPGSEILAACAGQTDKTGGWAELLADLKTLLETGEPMAAHSG